MWPLLFDIRHLQLLQYLSKVAMQSSQYHTHEKKLAYKFHQHLDIHPVENLFPNLSFQSSSCINLIGVKDDSVFMQEKIPNNKDHYNTSRFLEAHWHRFKKQHSTGVKIETATQNYFILTGKTSILLNNVTAFKAATGFIDSAYLSLGKLQRATLPIFYCLLVLCISLIKQVEKRISVSFTEIKVWDSLYCFTFQVWFSIIFILYYCHLSQTKMLKIIWRVVWHRLQSSNTPTTLPSQLYVITEQYLCLLQRNWRKLYQDGP